MNRKEYERMTERELKGRTGKLTEEVSSSSICVPKGTAVTITGKFGGLDVKAAACSCCGVSVYFRRLPPEYVELDDV